MLWFGLLCLEFTSHTMRVVPTPAIDSSPMAVARLATTILMPVRAREYLDLPRRASVGVVIGYVVVRGGSCFTCFRSGGRKASQR